MSRNSETTRRRLCCKKLGTIAMMLKACHCFSSGAYCCWKSKWWPLLEKHLKRWSGQRKTDRSPTEFSLKITTKSVFFDRLIFGWVCPENSCEIGRFFGEFVPKNPAKFVSFSAIYQKPCIVWYDPSDLKISSIEVGINLEVNWFCLSDLAHFLWWKQSRIRWNVCFNSTLLR